MDCRFQAGDLNLFVMFGVWITKIWEESELVHRRPQGWEQDIDQIYALYQQIGRSDLLAAIALATEQRCFGAEYLIAIAQDNTLEYSLSSLLHRS